MSARVVLLACLASLGFAAAADGATPAQLLSRYQPVTRFNVGGDFRPTSVETFISDSNLETRDATGAWVVANASPGPVGLPLPGSGTWRLNQRTCSPADGLAGAICFAGAWSAHGAPSVVYGRFVPGRRFVVLQYWYFYYDNFYSYAFPPSDFIWQAHEGDWEVVNVVLERVRTAAGNSVLRPRDVGYSQHCTGARRAWSRVPRTRRTHPLVYVAIGSHANYFGSGAHAIATKCIPAPALALLQQSGLSLPVDYTGAGSIAGPAALVAETTSIVRIRNLRPAWIRFPGTWGEVQYFHAPPPTGTVAFGLSPAGPAFQAVWRNPLKTLAGWPRR